MRIAEIIPFLHLTGFLSGAGLYGLILWLSLRHVAGVRRAEASLDRLPLATGVLGLIWNVAAIVALALEQSGRVSPTFLTALAYGALGFLPAVVIHSVVRTARGRWIAVAGYGVAIVAAVLQLASVSDPMRISAVLRSTTIAFVALTPILAFVTPRGAGGRTWWIAAFAVFAASGIHMSDSHVEHYSWGMELIGHHASLPLAFAILFYDYRFSFGDIFLKRALAFGALVLISGGTGLVLGELPWLRESSLPMFAVVIAIALGSAAIWNPLNLAAAALVDRVVLRRPDYSEVRRAIAGELGDLDDEEQIVAAATRSLASALDAKSSSWERESPDDAIAGDIVTADGRGRVSVRVDTSTAPPYRISLNEMEPGRRLLSDEFDLLTWAGTAVGRRVDAVRIAHERCQRDAHEQEMLRLAAQAELRALRAQVNPHFLFNALNTIGYLIRSAPDRAWQTLLLLTDLLRSSLREVSNVVPLEEELRFVRSYLEIEKARFEERLRVVYDVDPSLLRVNIPPFLLQPLVENAVKHGIATSRAGGEVRIQVTRDGDDRLVLTVEDDGAGATEISVKRGMRTGVGLKNIRERLQVHYGSSAELSLQWDAQRSRTVARVVLPLASAREAVSV